MSTKAGVRIAGTRPEWASLYSTLLVRLGSRRMDRRSPEPCAFSTDYSLAPTSLIVIVPALGRLIHSCLWGHPTLRFRHALKRRRAKCKGTRAPTRGARGQHPGREF